MYIFNSPDHQYACALENSRMMQAKDNSRQIGHLRWYAVEWDCVSVLDARFAI
jgi:hypothetical protein